MRQIMMKRHMKHLKQLMPQLNQKEIGKGLMMKHKD